MNICAENLSWKQLALVVACCFVFGGAFAHIKNEATQFPDIEFSEARFDIVLLVGAGIIPETPVFEPDKPFSKKDLAVWAALSANLGAGGETPDTEALAKAALNHGLVDTLEGDASYADLNMLFFDGQLTVDDAHRTPSKAEAASFIAAQLQTDAGIALLEKRGLKIGDTGEVTSVESGEDDHGSSTYVISIDNSTLTMHSHGRVANGPTDLLQWQGRIVRRSFLRGEDTAAMWGYLEAEPIEQPVSDEAMLTETQQVIEPAASNRNLLYGLILAVVFLGTMLFARRRRSG